MNQDDRVCPEAQTGGSSEQSPVPWSGAMLVLLDRRPFFRSLIKSYIFIVLVGYSGVIGSLTSLEWSWLPLWLELWTPIVDALRRVFPLFDNVEREFSVSGFGHRVAVAHHLIAFGWVAGTGLFAASFWGIITVSREEWVRFVRTVPRHWIAGSAFFGIFGFAAAGYWITVGYDLTSGAVQLDWLRSDVGLIRPGVYFSFAVLTGLMIGIGVGGIAVGVQVDRSDALNEETSQDRR